MVDAAHNAIVSISEKGKILSLNYAAVQMFQYSENELMGINIKILMPAEYALGHDAYLLHHAETGEKAIVGTSRRTKGKRKSGETFPIHLSISKIEIQSEVVFIGH
ncbi:MAG: PAS domain S-box-containing protein [Flavobacterium sp.]